MSVWLKSCGESEPDIGIDTPLGRMVKVALCVQATGSTLNWEQNEKMVPNSA